MYMQQEQWIREVMGSLEGLEKAEGNPYLATRVLARLEKPIGRQRTSLRPVLALASAAVLILLLNVFLWSRDLPDTGEQVTTATRVYDYDLTSIDY
jgi:hypothetical protein